MGEDQNFKVYLSFRDEATNKFKKATTDQINSVKKLGLAVKKEGAGVQVDLEKMSKSHEKAGRSARFHNRTISELQGSIGSLRNILLLYFFAMRPIMNMYRQATEAAIAQENAEMRLAAAFMATGRGSALGRKEIIEYASEMQALTGYGDDQIISSAALLANYKLTEEQVKKVIPVMLDMTSALKAGGGAQVNVEAIAKRLGLAFTGQASYLKRYGIIIDETTAKYGTFDEILEAIESSVKGTAVAMAQTFEGQRNIFRAAIGDYREQLGLVITQSPVVVASMRLISENIIAATRSVKESREETENFISTWERLAAAVIGVIGTIQFLWRLFLQGMRVIDATLIKVIADLLDIISEVTKYVKKMADIIPGGKKISNALQDIIDKTREWSDVSYEASSEVFDDFANLTTDVNFGAYIDGMINSYDRLLTATDNASKTQAESIKGLLQDALTNAVVTFNGVTEITKSAVIGMRDSLKDGFFKIIKGEFEGLTDVVISFGDMMIQKILEVIATAAIMKAMPWTASFFGFAGVSSHTGGYRFSLEDSYGYSKRRKFHNGGEVPATLLTGEGVVNRAGMKILGVDNLNRLNRGESMGYGQVINNYYIQTIDERSFRERLIQHGDIYANASEMSIRSNSSLRKTSQRWG